MSYRHLQLKDREAIQKLSDKGFTISKIAQEAGFHKSTISRELKKVSKRDYFANNSQKLAGFRRAGANQLRSKKFDRVLVRYILYLFRKECSPEQISMRLKLLREDQKEYHISHETIYKILYEISITRKIDFTPFFRHKKSNKRKKRSQRAINSAQSRRKSIHERPEEVKEKKEIGHWEGDLVEGKKGSGHIVTYVDILSRFLLSDKLDNKKAETFNCASRDVFADIDSDLIKSITYDQGTEMSDFENLEEVLQTQIYFCDPGKPYQRGLNENTNGLLRQYYKKGSDFRKIDTEELKQVIDKMNRRPRKCLNGLTPFEVFYKKVPKGVTVALRD